MEGDHDQLKWKQSSENVPKSQENNRQKELFSLCSEHEQGEPGLLFRADGALLTDDRKKAKTAEQAAAILSTKVHYQELQPLTRDSVHLHNPGGKEGRQDSSLYGVGKGYVESSPQSGRSKIRTWILITIP